MLVDQNMVCGLNTGQRDHFPRIQLVVSLFSGIYQICIDQEEAATTEQVIYKKNH